MLVADYGLNAELGGRWEVLQDALFPIVSSPLDLLKLSNANMSKQSHWLPLEEKQRRHS